MRTIEKTVYLFDELSDKAKDRAREWWRDGMDFAWQSESRQSIEAFCSHFGVNLRRWSVGPHYPLEYSHDAENHHFRGMRLRDFNRDNMPTGYCLDCDLWMTFYDRFKATGDAKAAFDDAVYAGFLAWQKDMEHQLSDECVDEMLIANEYEFDEEGYRV